IFSSSEFLIFLTRYLTIIKSQLMKKYSFLPGMYPHKMERQCAQPPAIEAEAAAMESYYIKNSRRSPYSRRKRLSKTPGLSDRVDKECKAWICYYFQPRSARLLSRRFKGIAQRIPNKHIASYLDISLDYFSRL